MPRRRKDTPPDGDDNNDNGDETGDLGDDMEAGETSLAVIPDDAIVTADFYTEPVERNGHSAGGGEYDQAFTRPHPAFGDILDQQDDPLIEALLGHIKALINTRPSQGATKQVASGQAMTTTIQDDDRRTWQVDIKVVLTAKPAVK